MALVQFHLAAERAALLRQFGHPQTHKPIERGGRVVAKPGQHGGPISGNVRREQAQ